MIQKFIKSSFIVGGLFAFSFSMSSCDKDVCYVCDGTTICEGDADPNDPSVTLTAEELELYVDLINALAPNTCVED